MAFVSEADKPLVWLHGEVKTPPFSKEARVEAGVLLRRLQRGETLSNTTIAWRHNTMNRTKRARLEAKGWRSGSAADFLELTPEEAAFIETKLALTETLRKRRTAQHLTQHSLAKRLSSSQSRIAKMEAGDSSVSVDLLLRALFALGAKPRDIANALQRRRRVAT